MVVWVWGDQIWDRVTDLEHGRMLGCQGYLNAMAWASQLLEETLGGGFQMLGNLLLGQIAQAT